MHVGSTPAQRTSTTTALRRALVAATAFIAALCSVASWAAQLTLAWDPSPDGTVVGYYVYYGTSSRNYPNRVDVGNATSRTVQNLTAGQTYFFAVTAYNAARAESGYSNEVSAAIPAPPPPATTSTALASSTNPSLYGSPVTFTANVTGAAPTGTVTFRNGSNTISGCSAASLAGSGNTRAATCTTSGLGIGSRSITASYGGDAGNAPSTSATLTQVVKAATTTTIASSLNPSTAGVAVTFTAQVTGSSPSGTVAFRNGGSSISGCGAVSLSGSGSTRSATCTTSALSAGTHAITAAYAGNTNNAASTSAALSQVVNGASPQPTFGDVPSTHWAYTAIEAVAYSGISVGCSTNPRQFCPDAIVSRDEMAVFLERAMRGLAYSYAPTGTRFADVPLSHWAAGPIEQLYLDGVTSGCATAPLRFCPSEDVTRASIAKFLLLARYGTAFVPGQATGTVFGDVPAGHWAGAWIEEFYRLGFTGGCSASPRLFCPDEDVTRAEMAVFLHRVFQLPSPP